VAANAFSVFLWKKEVKSLLLVEKGKGKNLELPYPSGAF
jgi:hypothetical protein